MSVEINTYATGAATTSHDATVLNASAEEPYLLTTGAGTADVTLSSLSTYNIDIFGDIQSYNPVNTPMLNILASMSSGKMSAPVKTWIDEYEGDVWTDIKLDDLRQATKNSSSYYNGKLAWFTTTTLPSAGVNATIGAELTELALASGNLLNLSFNTSDDYIRGKKEMMIRKLANTLAVLDYDEEAIAGSSKNYTHYYYTAGESYMAYMAFDDLAIACGSSATYYEKHEVIAGIKSFYFNNDFSEIIISLDFDDSNIKEILDSTYSNNTINLEEVSQAGGTVFDSTHGDYYTRFSRLVLIGNNYDVPEAIPEGDNYSDGGNFIFGQDQYMNYSQIFTSKKYGITGTRQATQLRFIDDWPKTRARHLQMYKNRIAAAMMFGVQSITYDSVTGYAKRTMSGFFDYGTFPIRYMKNPIPAISSETQQGAGLRNWMDDITYALNAYRQGSDRVHTCLCSRDVMKSLSDWNAYIGSSASNILGSTFQTLPPSNMTMGLFLFEYVGTYGTLRFVEEPALNYMPRFPYSVNSTTAGVSRGGAPVHLFSSGLSPRQMIICVDKPNAQFLSLRPDKIEGNIQATGQDMFQEAIRGEHSMQLRFPRNHAIIDVS